MHTHKNIAHTHTNIAHTHHTLKEREGSHVRNLPSASVQESGFNSNQGKNARAQYATTTGD